MVLPSPLVLSMFLPPLPEFPKPKGRDLMETFLSGLSILKSLTLYTLSSSGSPYLFPSTEGGSFSDEG